MTTCRTSFALTDATPDTSWWRPWIIGAIGPAKRTWRGIAPNVAASIERAVAEDHWPLVLTGSPGTGKTCAAWCAFDRCHGKRMYRQAPDLCDELIRKNQSEITGAVAGFWHDWRTARLVILDELGARERVSDFHYETVKRAIDTREGQPLVLVSNLSLGQIAKVYDDRIASRMAGGLVVECGGKDRRVER